MNPMIRSVTQKRPLTGERFPFTRIGAFPLPKSVNIMHVKHFRKSVFLALFSSMLKKEDGLCLI